jgi:DNA-binding transcriptional LysR family regulator
MDLRVLRYCEAIARVGSMSRAAEVLHIAQPAISVAVKKLEDELGVKLFARHANKRVTPTPEGLLLLKRAERIFQEADSARRELADAIELRSGEVKIGMPPMYGGGNFSPVLAAFHAKYPGISVTAIGGSATEVAGLLDRGEIDLAIIEARRVRSGWQNVSIGEEETVLAVHKNHPLAHRKRVKEGDLDGLDMVVFDETFLQRSVLDKRARKSKVHYRVVMQSNYVPLVHEAAATGLGGATLLRSMTDADPRLVGLAFEPPEVFRFSLCWLNERYLSCAGQAFIEFMQLRKSGASNPNAAARARGPF